MTYSIFESTGNLIDAFMERAAALEFLARIAQTEPDAANEVYLVTQDEDGKIVGETVDAAAVSVSLGQA